MAVYTDRIKKGRKEIVTVYARCNICDRVRTEAVPQDDRTGLWRDMYLKGWAAWNNPAYTEDNTEDKVFCICPHCMKEAVESSSVSSELRLLRLQSRKEE